MFRRLSLIFSFVLVAGLTFGQFRGLPMPTAKKDTVVRDIKTWTVDDIYGPKTEKVLLQKYNEL